MTRELLEELRAELGGTPPRAFERLEPAALSDLIAALREARIRRAQLHEQAVDHALSRLPAPARRRLRRRLIA